MDPTGIINAAGLLSLPALILVVAGGIVFAGVKVIGWASQVTTLLGNHLMHKMDEQTDSLKRIETNLNEQTLVLRAVGRMLMELNTGKKDF